MKTNRREEEGEAFLKIKAETLCRTDITSTQKIVLSRIKGFSGECYEKYSSMADVLGMSEDSVSKSVKRLVKLGLLSKEECPLEVRKRKYPKRIKPIRRGRRKNRETNRVGFLPTPVVVPPIPVGVEPTPLGCSPTPVVSDDTELPLKMAVLLDNRLDNEEENRLDSLFVKKESPTVECMNKIRGGNCGDLDLKIEELRMVGMSEVLVNQMKRGGVVLDSGSYFQEVVMSGVAAVAQPHIKVEVTDSSETVAKEEIEKAKRAAEFDAIFNS